MENFIYDLTFLHKVNSYKIKRYWAAIMVLDFETERPICRFEGKVVSGQLSVAANSPTRRTGSLNVIFDETTKNITDITNLIAIDKKISLSIGMSNPFYETEKYRQYGDILWYNQGVMIITKASSSVSPTSASVSVNFIDKMGYLNGTCSGTLPANTSFHDRQIVNGAGEVTVQFPLISDIIRECVHHFGGEHYSRILIEDIEDVGRQVVTYEGSTPINFATFENGEKDIIRKAGGNFIIGQPPIKGFMDHYVKGEIVGYLETPLTYPGELVVNAGSTVTQVLDQIVQTLGNYEYFYDPEGVFHFRKKKNYEATGATPLNFGFYQDSKGMVVEDNRLQRFYFPVFSADAFLNEFNDSSLITQVSFNPNYDKIKNDFIVWGTKDNNSTSPRMCRYHLAIDEKPIDTEDALCHKYIVRVSAADDTVLRYYATTSSAAPVIDVDAGDPADGKAEFACKPLEVYFSPTTQVGGGYPFQNKEYHFNWREELYRMALISYGNSADVATSPVSGGVKMLGAQYFEELRAEWRLIFDPESTIENVNKGSFQAGWEDRFGKDAKNPWYGYRVEVVTDPGQLNYWLDLIDTGATVGQFSVARIGRRSKVQNNSKINQVFESPINDIVFIDTTNEDFDYLGSTVKERISYYNSIGQTYSLLSANTRPLFSPRSSYGTCYDDIRAMLYSDLIYNSSVSITALPLFYLDVNKILRLNLPEQGVSGDYVINNISYSFGQTATMTLSLQEAMVLA